MNGDHATTGSEPRRRIGSCWLIVAAVIALLPGCSGANWGIPGTSGAATNEESERTKDAMLRQFEARRSAMTIEAAEAALNRGDYKDSEQALRSVLDRDPANRDARLLLAEVMLLTGRRPEAFTQLEHALREHGDDPRVHYAMALLLDASGRPNDARNFYSRSTELDSQFAVYTSQHNRVMEAEIPSAAGMAVAYHSQSGDAEANERLAAPTSGEPRLPGLPMKTPGFAAEPSAVAPDATTTTVAAVDRFESRFGPEIADLLREGCEALAAGSADSAIIHFRNAAEADPQNPQIPVHAAVLALERNHPAMAVDLLKPAAGQFSKSVAVHLTLGTAYYRLGDYPSSQVALRQALSLDNSNGLAYLLMGCTLEKLGQPEAALVQWERAAAVCPRYRNMRR